MSLDLHRRSRSCLRLRRPGSNRCLAIIGVVLLLICAATYTSRSRYAWLDSFDLIGSPRMPTFQTVDATAPLPARVSCLGPRGRLLSESSDDDLSSAELDSSYPVPFWGSHQDLDLDTTWMTFDDRYGPYGYGEDDASYGREKVDWKAVHWGRLQSDCLARNTHRFPRIERNDEDMSAHMRMTYRDKASMPTTWRWDEVAPTRRTAVVLRAYSGFDYKSEDMFYIRSLLVELGLKTGGEYQVILLVDIKDAERSIFESAETYREALEAARVPVELHSIAVLWEEGLLRSWYPKVEEHRTVWQVYQPLQLFALHYPEFDHYWQLELDMRITGDAGRYLDRLADFARNEPRKQALERTMFPLMQTEIGNYAALQQAVDRAASSNSYAWGPVRIPDIRPIGPRPPVAHPSEDAYTWGVGEDADVIVTSFCANVTNSPHWAFQDWIYGFSAGVATQRFLCPPAMSRTSRALLGAIHASQLEQGLSVPSEATPISFALWNGLKVSYPPLPVYWRAADDAETRAGWWKGGPAASIYEGRGPPSAAHPSGQGLTFWWESYWPRQIVDAWMGRESEAEAFPWILARQNGKVYVPNMMLHPVKH